MATVLTKVQFRFASLGDADNVWRVVHLHAREGLSELYFAVVELACQNLLADPDALLGQDAALLFSRDAHQRRLQGIVHRVEHVGVKAGHQLCRVHVGPALLALAQRRNHLIFQDVTALDAAGAVLNGGFAAWQRTFRSEAHRTPPTREYFVQYNESDLDFVLRLLAEEGVGFYFDHAGEREEMVLFDANATCAAMDTMDDGALTLQGPEAGTAEVETVRDFDLVHDLRSTSVVVRDFDWTQPRLDLTRETRGADDQGRDREVYEYPGPMTIGGYSPPAYGEDDGAAQSKARRQLFKSRERRFVGEGVATTMTAGQTFALTGHRTPGFDGSYLLTRVEHFAHAPEQLTNDTHGEHDGREERYRNAFECIPLDVPFRPARSFVRPRIGGVQTATVVGPAGEEIYTDEHGRVKVQFHWDREGTADESSSCWVRVAQNWAGNGWGFVFLPRIGMEVVVQFLEGNPDRPLVTGCVYNGQNRPPYPLPDEKTKSTIKTNSTVGEGFNELRFEDLAGSEEVFVHAQKDFNEVVENDHNTLVHHDQTNTVDHDQTESIGADQSLSVGNNRTSSVEVNESLSVGADQTTFIGANRTETVTATEKVTVQGPRSVTVEGPDSEAFHANRITHVTGIDSTSVNGMSVTEVAGPLMASASDSVTLLCSPTTVELKPGTLHGSASDEIVWAVGGCSIKVNAFSIVLDTGMGAKIELTGPTILVNGSIVAIKGAAVDLDGGVTNVTGKMTTITGSPVKINC